MILAGSGLVEDVVVMGRIVVELLSVGHGQAGAVELEHGAQVTLCRRSQEADASSQAAAAATLRLHGSIRRHATCKAQLPASCEGGKGETNPEGREGRDEAVDHRRRNLLKGQKNKNFLKKRTDELVGERQRQLLGSRQRCGGGWKASRKALEAVVASVHNPRSRVGLVRTGA